MTNAKGVHKAKEEEKEANLAKFFSSLVWWNGRAPQTDKANACSIYMFSTILAKRNRL
jgi:hypothetical protein